MFAGVSVRVSRGLIVSAADVTDLNKLQKLHCESKKLCHFYFYGNFSKCWSILKIFSMSESERNGSKQE